MGHQYANHHQQLKYYCSKCDTLLRKTNIDIDFRLYNSKEEECPCCGSLISKTLSKEKEHCTSTSNTNMDSHKSSSSSSSSLQCLLPAASPPPSKIQTAYEQFSNKLTFGIQKIDSVLKLTTGETACIVSTYDDNNTKKYLSILVSRLCIRALMSNIQGGFNSSKVIFVDAGNTSDIVYRCINFARQYGLNIKRILQSIIISRSFTIYQLTNVIINELPNKVIKQFSDAKVVVISDLLYMFANNLQVELKKEAESLLRQIINAIIKMSLYNNILFVISFCHGNATALYARLILQRIAKCIEITRGDNDKKKKHNNKLSIAITIKNGNSHSNKKQHHQLRLVLHEKMLHLVSD